MNGGTEKMTRKSGVRRHIVRELAQEILDSERSEDRLLASEHELCRRFDVSRATIRLALVDLESQGMVYRRHGKGTFARGRLTRIHADLVILGSAAVWGLRPLSDLIAGMQAVLSPLPAGLLLVSEAPSKWSAEAARTWNGVLVIRDDLDGREEAALQAFPFRHLRLAESALAHEESDLFEVGRRAAVMLNYAAATKTPLDQRQWEQCTLQIKRESTTSAGQPARLSHLPAGKIEAILRLVRKREAIKARLQIVEMQLAEMDTEEKGPAKVEPKLRTFRPRKRGKVRVPMKDAVLAVLKLAGPEGMRASEIAERIGRKASTVAVWLYTDGARIPGVSKPYRGQFAYREPEHMIPQAPPGSGDTPILPDEEVKIETVPAES
jgi:DNA-binding transcriptional ArsR family regulator